MDEMYQHQQEQDNLAGMDLCEEWHEKNRMLLDQFDGLIEKTRLAAPIAAKTETQTGA